MRKHAFAFVVAVVLLAVAVFAGDKPEVKEEKDKISYSVGYQVGGDFKRQGTKLNPELLVRGVQDAMGEREPLMTREEMRKTLSDLKKRIVADQRKREEKAAAENLAKGEAFLAENRQKQGVVTLPSGLQYTVIAEGSGRSPGATDNVTVHYRGTLMDGTEFDSSRKRNKPATFRVDRVIAGWKEALPMMKEGATWRLFVPAKLGYGDRGAGPGIPPDSVLVFDLELISVTPAK